ncbi:PREDICTED: solute carrier family 22 member 8-like [Priapulus caudatus]|uniref:Solute carrier family 22 member 8-like n=1 Tax=Priapulus caudatus TaxID=37621 RepID=A0ABM1F570_PRICU|nr:PREDICTED: solute carrier family 22 member 8-like [Priapulus caudatus]
MKPATAMAMDVDAAMMQAGGFGRYQMIIFTVISVMDLCVAWHVMSINLHRCRTEYHCKWDLVCDMKVGVQLTITVYMFGKLFGALIAPQVADFFGRKPTAICLGLSYVAFGVAKVFTQSYAQFMVMHFFMALSQTGAGLAAFVLLCESVPQSSRATVGLVFMNVWSVGIMTLPLLAYFIPNWRTLQLTMVLPMTITITYYW